MELRSCGPAANFIVETYTRRLVVTSVEGRLMRSPEVGFELGRFRSHDSTSHFVSKKVFSGDSWHRHTSAVVQWFVDFAAHQ
jgi:hypothetical protein